MSKGIFPNPFGWDMTEQREYKSFYEQRKASYKEPAETVYQSTGMDAFRYGAEAPTPQLSMVDGYKSEKEITE